MTIEIFANALKRAIERDLSAIELIGVADQLRSTGELPLLIKLYQTWIEHNQGNPIMFAVYYNFGVVLNGANDLAGATAALGEAIKLNPTFIPAYINLGSVLERQGAVGAAVEQWNKVVELLPAVTPDAVAYKMSSLKQIGRVLENTPLEENAEDMLRRALEIDPNQRDAIQHWTNIRQKECKWPVLAPFANVTRKMLAEGISPHSLTAHTDDPLLHLAKGYLYNREKIGRPARFFRDAYRARLKDRKPTDRLRIGYLCSYLRDHAHGFLTSEIYQLHNRDKLEIFAYSCCDPTGDQTQKRIKDGVDHWVDTHAMTDEQTAQLIVDDKIDILIDFNCYTGGARLGVFAMMPAPIIVNWLGYPGSTGSPYHHYIIADNFIIPPDHELYYSEKVVRLPCYQPNDRYRVMTNRPWTRAAAGLPEDGIVYCCFNGVQKVTPFMWRRYMSILEQVPGSVLWVLEGYESINNRLREAAATCGIAPERIVFAPKLPNPEHLARYHLADLFLDTAPCGAHTTASDALWTGVPVLTVAGRGFAARVCGSLVTSAGLADLVCTTPDAYVAKAVELGNDREKLAGYRQSLAANRDTCVLFDTPSLVAHLDDLYLQMWDDFTKGNLPRPDLTNLDVYNAVGVEIDDDNLELMAVEDYHGLYKQKLRQEHAFRPIRADTRLWTEEDSAS